MNIGRNDPCPCGSGIKYKRCCGAALPKSATADATSIATLLAHAETAARVGNHAQALEVARHVLKERPDNLLANQICGVALAQLGDLRGAERFFQLACYSEESMPLACSNLGRVRELLGDLNGAETANRRALEQDATLADAHNNLGNLMRARGRLADAISHYRKAAEADPDNQPYVTNLAGAHLQAGNFDEVEHLLGPRVATKVGFIPAYTTLGAARLLRGLPEQALECFEQALALNPNDPQVLVNLGATLGQLGHGDRAVAVYNHAFVIDPGYLARYGGNLMNLYLEKRDLDSAHELALRVTADARSEPYTLSVAAGVFGSSCDFRRREQVELILRPVMLAGGMPLKALLGCHYTEVFTDDELLSLHRLRAAQIEEGISAPYVHVPIRNAAERPLRIGYLSPDFRDHAMGHLVSPFFGQHDRDNFCVHAYHTQPAADGVTDAIRRSCHGFRNISALAGQQAAEIIQEDGIDILVDLAGHTAGSRLDVLARRPAPVQATYLGYPDTTGLSAVDYVILDPYVAGGSTRYVESKAVLPECLVTFSTLPTAAVDGDAPVNRSGFVTFGSMNNLNKLNESIVTCWARILNRVPKSRLLIAYGGAESAIAQENLRRAFAVHGISSERVILRRGGARQQFLENYREIDILLDSFPYSGTTTTCEALLMNIPVVTLTGNRQCSRVSASILKHLGLAHLVASKTEEYVRIAAELAADTNQLENIRASLPARLTQSTLRNTARFTRGLEALYRAMWERWMAGEARGDISALAKN